MTKKVRCTVTGNIIYMTEKRYAKVLAKYGSEEALKANYVSMTGRHFSGGQVDELEMHQSFRNRIRCSITDRWQAISNQRIKAGVAKYGSWEKLCEVYVCRPAARLLREGKTVDEIKKMVSDGTFPEK